MDGSRSVNDRLLEVLRSVTSSPALAFDEPPTSLTGGRSTELYTFKVHGAPPQLSGRLVLRLLSDDRTAVRETTIHRAVVTSGYPAPAVRCSGDSASAFGRPFVVMDMADGSDVLRAVGVRRAFGVVPELLAGLMVRLHDLASDNAGQQLEARGWTSTELGPRGVLTEIADSFVSPNPLARRFAHLSDACPGVGSKVIVHGDLHGLNVLMRDGQASTVLDWELARITHPEFDVARTKVILDSVPGMSSRLLRPLVQSFGRRTGKAFVLAYRRQRVLDDTRLTWWEAAHCLRLVAMVTGRSASAKAVRDVWAPLRDRLLNRFDELMSRSI